MVLECWLQVDEVPIAQSETTFVRSKHFGSLKFSFGVGTKIVNDVPELEPVLKTVRSQDVLDYLGSEAMASPTPESGQTELCV